MATNVQSPHEQKFLPPPQIPDHELLRCIGSGSYGEVWLARNIMGTFRAVKVVYRGTFSNDRPYEREFHGLQKFEPVSRSHDGFIDILQIGRNEAKGYYYCVMELADDAVSGPEIDPDQYQAKTLGAALIGYGHLSFEESVGVGTSLAAALSHLHKHGLIHRDIKPSNIIFVNGIPKIADIGLVAEAGVSHSIVGTEGFMPPEGPGTPQADIYSLGKVLYEISTGQDRKAFPELPETIDELGSSESFSELNEVILRACERNVEKRYQTAEEMHRDLLLLQAGRSVKRLRLLERRMVHLKKGAAIGAVLAVIVGTVLFQVNRELKLAAERRQEQVGRNVAYGTRFIDEGDFFGALPAFVEALSLDRADPLQQETHRVRLASTLEQCPRIQELWFLDLPVLCAQLSQDGKFLLAGGANGQAVIQNLAQNSTPIKLTEQSGYLEGVSISQDGLFALTTSERGVDIWETKTAQRLRKLAPPGTVYNAQFSPDGQRIATATWDNGAGVVSLWETTTGKLLTEVVRNKAGYRFASFSPDGQRLVTAGEDKLAQVWDLESGQSIGEPIRHGAWVFHASFSPEGRTIVTASFDGTAQVCDVETGHPLMPPLQHPAGVKSAHFSPDGRYIITACWDFTARIWNARTGRPLHPFLKHNGKHVMYATFTPDSRRVLTANGNGVVTLWDLARGRAFPGRIPVEQNPGIDQYVLISSNKATLFQNPGNDITTQVATGLDLLDVKQNHRGTHLLTISAPAPGGSLELVAQVWESSSGQPASAPFALTGSSVEESLSADQQRVWNCGEGVVLRGPQHEWEIQPVCLSPDGKLIGFAHDSILSLFDSSTGKEVHDLDHEGEPVGYTTFSPNGTMLVTCTTSDGTLFERSGHLWDVASGTRTGLPLRHADGVSHAAFSPDGKRVVTASEDGTACVWDAQTGRALTPHLRHGASVTEASFSPDGRWIVTASQGGTARVWDSETGEPITPPLLHPFPFWHAQFVQNGKAVLTRSTDGQSALWPLVKEAHSIEELARLAQILSGHQGDYTSGLLPHEPAALRTQWENLRAAQPDYFHVGKEHVLTWHQREAQVGEEEENWDAAAFHWKQLAQLDPANTSFGERLRKAQAEALKTPTAPGE